MSMIPVQIIFHGLIALVPHNGVDGANHATALLVDARKAPEDATCVVAHTPEIHFVTSGPECTAADPVCKLDRGECRCKLDSHEISILPDAEPTPTKATFARKPSSLPFDEKAAGDFAYVANLVQLGQQLDPRFLEADPPAALVARLRFPLAELTTCTLATRSDDRTDYIHPLNFRPLKTEEQDGEVSQALAQMVLANYAADVDEGEALRLRLSPFPGATSQVHEFRLLGDATGVGIMVSNSRPPEEHIEKPDDPCDDGIGREFAFLYNLALNPPDWAARPVPHVKYRMSKSVTDVTPNACEKNKSKAPMSRPICPLGSFVAP